MTQSMAKQKIKNIVPPISDFVLGDFGDFSVILMKESDD